MHGYISPENGNKTVSVVVQEHWNCTDALLAVGSKANISKSRQQGTASTALVLAAILGCSINLKRVLDVRPNGGAATT